MMKYVQYFALIFLINTNAWSQDFTWLNPLPTGNRLNSIKFVNENIGFIAGDCGTILKTINGGSYWENLYPGSYDNLKSISLISDSNAKITAYVVGDKGTILKTLNNGVNWIKLNSGTVDYLSSVSFVDTMTGFVVGQNGLILKTINGGKTWEKITSGNKRDLNSVCFTDRNHGYVVCDSGAILYTKNGGLNWKTIHTRGYLESIYRGDNNKVYVFCRYCRTPVLKFKNGKKQRLNKCESKYRDWRSIVFCNDNSHIEKIHGQEGTQINESNLNINFKSFFLQRTILVMRLMIMISFLKLPKVEKIGFIRVQVLNNISGHVISLIQIPGMQWEVRV